MAALRDAVSADLSGYIPAAPALPVVPQMITDNRPKANPSIRCPLPPFNSNPDTLRQFETGMEMPQLRVIPLPINKGAAPTTTSTSSTASASTSSASSSGSSTAALTPATVNINTGIVNPGANYLTSVVMGKSFQLLNVSSSSLCEVRLYGTALAQAADIGRVTDAPVPAETMQNLISCVIFDTVPYFWGWQNRVGVNQDSPQTTNIYVTVFNTDVTPATNINLAIKYLVLET